METCRACLQTDADKYYSIFKKIHRITLERMFHSLTGLSVTPDDGLPNCFCEECADLIVTCNNFRKKCLKSDAHLRALEINIVSEEVLYTIEELEDTLEDINVEVSESNVTEETYYTEEIEPTARQQIISTETDSTELQNGEESDYEVYGVIEDVELVDNISSEDNDDDDNDNVDELNEDIVECIVDPLKHSQIAANETDGAAPNDTPTTSLILRCCVCTGVQFTSVEDLKQHGLEVHKTESAFTSPVRYNCVICHKRFCRNAHLSKDTAALEPMERYACSECPATYRGRAALHSHMKSKHVGKRTYVCDVCQKAFHTSSTLVSHRQIHGEKKFQCNTCTKSFVRRHDLVVHQKVHSTERPYACTVCDMRFKSRSHLRGHQSVHTGERSKKCRICGEGFRTYSDRLVHEKQHENVHPFKCDYCDKKYGRNYKLQVHIRKVHTGEQPFACTDCSKRFFQRWELTAHRRMDHSEVDEIETVNIQ